MYKLIRNASSAICKNDLMRWPLCQAAELCLTWFSQCSVVTSACVSETILDAVRRLFKKYFKR